jgi:hypothetical protein
VSVLRGLRSPREAGGEAAEVRVAAGGDAQRGAGPAIGGEMSVVACMFALMPVAAVR